MCFSSFFLDKSRISVSASMRLDKKESSLPKGASCQLK